MRLGICGISGRMGRAVLSVALRRGHAIAAAFEDPSSFDMGADAGDMIHAGKLGVPVSVINGDDLHRSDCVIDFSTPGASLALVEQAVAAQRPLVIGTTGFTVEQRARIEAAGSSIPLLLSPNMSLGVNLLFRLTEIAAQSLHEGYDAEIFEAHHRFKLDAPSGTARRIVEILKRTMPSLADAREVTGRQGITGERTSREIGIMSMRGGDTVGEHTVFFAGSGERLELTHRATSRETFAAGAVSAAEFLSGRGPGLYTMFDVLGLS